MSKENIHPIWRIASIVTLGLLRTRVRTKERVIYLTFDDGPHPEHTPKLLALLRQFHARGSFFLVASECLKYESVVKQIVDDGHQIGNHSHTHPIVQSLSSLAQWKEYSAADQILAKVANCRPPFALRPPRGNITLAALIYGLFFSRQLCLWSRDSLDGELSSREVCTAFLRKPIQGGDVLLFHDDSCVCIEALQVMLPEWQKNGFRFVA